MIRERRRPAEMSVHDWQHLLLDERFQAWQSHARRTGVDKVQRREALKRAWWTMRGHLRAHHNIRIGHGGGSVDWATAHALHIQSHAVQQ